MSYLILPVLLFLTVAPTPGPPARVLSEFSQFSKAIDKQIALVEADGTVREGVLIAAKPDSVTMRFASGMQSFARGEIASAERMKDGRVDGAIKGALFGFLLSAMASQGLQSSDDAPRFVANSVASFAAIGFLLDAAETNRRPLYRAPAPPPGASKPGLSLSFRF